MTKIFRVVVRGQFAELDPETRERLVAEASDHDIFKSAFTTEGTFTYDPALVWFNLRYETRVADDHAGTDPIAAAVAQAIERATAWLTNVGIAHKHVRATATDMASMWQ